MKRTSSWDEKTIENELKQMPSIEDKQTKEQVYLKIQQRLDEQQARKKPRFRWHIPVVATAAVLFLLFVIVPPFFDEDQLSQEELLEDEFGTMMDVGEYIPEEAPAEDDASIMTEDSELQVMNGGYIRSLQDHSLFSEDRLVTVAFPVFSHLSETVIKLTLEVPAPRNSVLERFMIAKAFDGKNYGINSFPSISFNDVTEIESTVTIDLPENSLQSLSSVEDVIYELSLRETFSALGYDKIELTSDGERGVLWGQQDIIFEIDLTIPNRGYYIFESSTSHQFLVSGHAVNAPLYNKNSQLLDFYETLLLMQQGDVMNGYLPSIPGGIEILDATIDGNIAYVTIANTVVDGDDRYVAMLEAIMFAAKDFGAEFVQFNGIENQFIDSYYLDAAVEIPKYINFIPTN